MEIVEDMFMWIKKGETGYYLLKPKQKIEGNIQSIEFHKVHKIGDSKEWHEENVTMQIAYR